MTKTSLSFDALHISKFKLFESDQLPNKDACSAAILALAKNKKGMEAAGIEPASRSTLQTVLHT